ncbi:MAG TPA: hypothetical protein VFW98_17345 [Gemmatimonadaceae bacterium]|nr:hypothetical protein [Gemmatimonadaceae bacterium]
MKGPRQLRSAAVGMMALSLLAAAAGCADATGPGCRASTDVLVNDVRTRLNDGTPVATFHFEQRYQSYFDAGCGSTGGPIGLTILSDAPTTQSFSFTASGIGADGSVDWRIHGHVDRLTPGATEDEGEVVVTDLPVDQGIRIDLDAWASP